MRIKAEKNNEKIYNYNGSSEDYMLKNSYITYVSF